MAPHQPFPEGPALGARLVSRCQYPFALRVRREDELHEVLDLAELAPPLRVRHRPQAAHFAPAVVGDECPGWELLHVWQEYRASRRPRQWIGRIIPIVAVRIEEETTVADLLEHAPATRPVLAARGIDICCGGFMTLAQAASARGIGVAELLLDLERAAAAGEDPVTDAGVAPSAEAPLFPPFLRVALWCTLTMGATFGALNLLQIQWALGVVPPAHNWFHAEFQIWGFVFLFVMGIAYHALPRFLDVSLWGRPVARATLWITLAGLMVHGYGRFGSLLPATLPALFVGAAVMLVGVVLFAGIILRTLGRVRTGFGPHHALLATGTLWWAVAAGLLLAQSYLSYREGELDDPGLFNQGVYAAALFGGAFSWILGMFLRTAPTLLAARAPRPLPVVLAFLLVQAGSAASVFGAVTSRRPLMFVATDVGLLLLAAGAVAFVAGTRVLARAAPQPAAIGIPHFARVVRMAFAFLLLFALLATTYGALDLTGRVAEKLLHDGARHAFALGFVTLMIFAMAGRLVPVFTGLELLHPRRHALGTSLIAIGVLLREVQVIVVMTGRVELLYVSGASGLVAATGVVLAASSILATLRAARRGAPTEASKIPPAGQPTDPRAAIEEALRRVLEPDLGVNVVDLGLIYAIDLGADGAASIRTTLTSEQSHHGERLLAELRRAALSVPGVTTASIELTFDPPWSFDRVDPAMRKRLGVV